jgi:phosphoserine phosphatase
VKFLKGTTGRRRIYLMRHGHVNYMSEEVRASKDTRIARLTELGIEQAKAAGPALADVHFDVAMCSGLRRTRETAEYVLAQQSVAPTLEVDARLEELHSGTYIDFASREQLSATLAFYFDKAGEDGASFLEGGELFSEAQTRAVEGIEALLMRPDWSTALVVAHEGINRLILSWMARAGCAASGAFEQDLACINVLDFDLVRDGDETRIERRIIKAVNVTPYAWVKAGHHLTSFEAIFSPVGVEPEPA